MSDITQIDLDTVITAFDDCDKITLLKWLKALEGKTHIKTLQFITVSQTETTKTVKLRVTFDDDNYADSNTFTIEGASSIAFADITGQPSDNTALNSVLASKQPKFDNSLTTTAKYVVSAINENKSNIDNVRAVAEGKCKAYVISVVNNPLFNTQAQIVGTNQIVTIDGQTVSVTDLKVGDIIYTMETDTPDRWYMGEVSEVIHHGFGVLETSKVDLDEYQTKDDNTLATTSKEVVGAINELHQENIDERDDIAYLTSDVSDLQSDKQDKTDNSLTTTAKYVVGAINENKSNIDTKLTESQVKALILATHPVGTVLIFDYEIGTGAITQMFGGGTWQLWYSGYIGGGTITSNGALGVRTSAISTERNIWHKNSAYPELFIGSQSTPPGSEGYLLYTSGLSISPSDRKYVYIYRRVY